MLVFLRPRGQTGAVKSQVLRNLSQVSALVMQTNKISIERPRFPCSSGSARGGSIGNRSLTDVPGFTPGPLCEAGRALDSFRASVLGFKMSGLVMPAL